MKRVFAGLLIVMASVACQRSEEPAEQLNEMAKTRSGSVDVILLSPHAALSVGKDSVTVEFRSASDGRLVDVGMVKASAMMPMAGMSPMFGPVEVQPTAVPGRYVASSELSMAGEWRLSLEWNGPAGQGSATFSPMVH